MVKKSFFLLGLAFFTISATQVASARAQPQADSAVTKAQLEIKAPLQHVKLDAQQKAEIKEILAKRTENEKAYKQSHGSDKAAINAYKVEQTKVALASIKLILTPTQWQQFTAAQLSPSEPALVDSGPEPFPLQSGPGTVTTIVDGVIIRVPARTHVKHEHHKPRPHVVRPKRRPVHHVKPRHAIKVKRQAMPPPHHPAPKPLVRRTR